MACLGGLGIGVMSPDKSPQEMIVMGMCCGPAMVVWVLFSGWSVRRTRIPFRDDLP
jgi:hypothetical protein